MIEGGLNIVKKESEKNLYKDFIRIVLTGRVDWVKIGCILIERESKMNNKAVLAFISNSKATRYGKWSFCGNSLRFGYRLVAERKGNTIKCFDHSIVECGFEYNTLHAIEKVQKFLNK